jgi:DNA-directed RNA polymerase II subunit RPB1
MLYGGDGVDTKRMIRVKYKPIFLSDSDLVDRYKFDPKNTKLTGNAKPHQSVFDNEIELIKSDRDFYRHIKMRIENNNFTKIMNNTSQLPVDIGRTVKDLLVTKKVNNDKKSIKTLDELIDIYEMVREFCRNLPYVFINEIQEKMQSKIPEHLENAVTLVRMFIRFELNCKTISKFTKNDVIYILDSIKLGYARSLIEYGASVGIWSSESVSEPITQYMLDSHHRSVAGGTSRAGIIRPKEILGAKSVKDEQTTEMMLRVIEKFESNKIMVQKIADQIELMDFIRFISKWDILIENFNTFVYPPYKSDKEWVSNFIKYNPLIRVPTDITKWCIRVQLDKSSMILNSMSLELIVEKIRTSFPGLYVVYNSESYNDVIIRMYLRESLVPSKDIISNLVKFTKTELFKTVIRGIENIQTATVVDIQRHYIDDDGALKIKKIYAIKTTGTNMSDILLNPYIDPYTIISSSVDDTKNMLGIDAARDAIVRELDRFMGDKSPNVRHLMLYGDQMTITGNVTALTPGGIDVRENTNVLLRMGASNPINIIRKAAINNMTTELNGLTSNYVMGRPPKLGSLYNDYEFDETYIKHNYSNVNDAFDDLD